MEDQRQQCKVGDNASWLDDNPSARSPLCTFANAVEAFGVIKMLLSFTPWSHFIQRSWPHAFCGPTRKVVAVEAFWGMSNDTLRRHDGSARSSMEAGAAPVRFLLNT